MKLISRVLDWWHDLRNPYVRHAVLVVGGLVLFWLSESPWVSIGTVLVLDFYVSVIRKPRKSGRSPPRLKEPDDVSE